MPSLKSSAHSSEDRGKLRARTLAVIKRLKKNYPDAEIALRYSNPLELLVSTILSAQCTDVRVNMVTPNLFNKYQTARDYATANRKEFEAEIRSTGFFRAKTKSILGCCKALVERHAGRVPDLMEELLKLPGVGRKTANVVLGGAFGKAEGIVVDTHVRRLAGRLGFTKHINPEKIELDLMDIVPNKDWFALGNLLIWHGREICQARKPKCRECSVGDLCPSFGVFMKSLYAVRPNS